MTINSWGDLKEPSSNLISAVISQGVKIPDETIPTMKDSIVLSKKNFSNWGILLLIR